MERTLYYNIVCEIPHMIKVDEDSKDKFLMSKKIIQFMKSVTGN